MSSSTDTQVNEYRHLEQLEMKLQGNAQVETLWESTSKKEGDPTTACCALRRRSALQDGMPPA